MMKFIFLILFLSVHLIALDKLNIPSEQPDPKAQKLLESISKYAIKIGHGDYYTSYVFVDPMCPFSRRYMKQLLNNKVCKNYTTYYIFLYKLPTKDSAKLINYIYQSDHKLQVLKSIMVNENIIKIRDEQLKEHAKNSIIVEEIATVAEKLHINIRPYIIEFRKDSPYCTVSSGTAPCLEENNF